MCEVSDNAGLSPLLLRMLRLILLALAIEATQNASAVHIEENDVEEEVLKDESETKPVPVLIAGGMSAFNLVKSAGFAVAMVKEVKFRNGGIASFNDATGENIENMRRIANGDEALEADGLLGLQAFEKVAEKVHSACNKELKEDWGVRALDALGWKEREEDEEFERAVSVLREEVDLVSETLQGLLENKLCPALGNELHKELMNLDIGAKSYSRRTGQSLYYMMAKETPASPADHPREAWEQLWSGGTFTYADVLDDECFEIPSRDARLQSQAELAEEMAKAFQLMFDEAQIFLSELLELCPQWERLLPGGSAAVARCVPQMHDAMTRARFNTNAGHLVSTALDKSGPVLKWYQASEAAINSMFDGIGVLKIAASLAKGPGARELAILMRLAYRAGGSSSIRTECLEAARVLKEENVQSDSE